MTNKRTIPAGLDCVGCKFREVCTIADNRNILSCTNQAVATNLTLQADVSACFQNDQDGSSMNDAN